MDNKNEKRIITLKTILLFILSFVISSGAIAFSYLYGSCKKSDKFYSALMSLDYKVKNQNNTDFLHGEMSYVKSIEERDKYNSFLNYQRMTKTQYSYYNSFLVSSSQGEFVDYDFIYSTEKGIETTKSKVIEVATYYDFHFMESIGLPLFDVSDTPSKINSKYGADLGSYISAARAEEIVENNGMLAESNGDLRLAFKKLLSDDSFKFIISNGAVSSNESYSMSINNIYLDNDHSYLLNDFQKSVQVSRYGNYSKTFDYWFADSVFTFSYSIFSRGCSYIFDVRKNYGNLDRFFNLVIGYDYGAKNLSISCFNENNALYSETSILNDISSENSSRIMYLFLVLSILLFALDVFLFFMLFKWCKKIQKLPFIVAPFFAFLITQSIFHILLVTKISKYSLYIVFNSSGNVVVMTGVIIITVSMLVGCKYVRKV